MKKPTDELFRLIKSMSKGEKINFKQYVGASIKGGKTNYLMLYETIEKMTGYNEDKVKGRLKGKINTTYFAYEKNNLYNLICKSLIVYHADKSAEAQLSEMIDTGKVLFRKRLYDESLRKFKKAEQLALKYEFFTHILDVYKWQRRILFLDPDEQKQKEIIELSEREQEIFDKYENIIEYEILHQELYIHRLETDERNLESKNEVKKLQEHPFFKDKKKAKSFTAMKDFFRGRHVIANMKGDYEKGILIIEEFLIYQEENEHFIKENPGTFANTLTNLLMNQSNTDNYENALSTFQKLTGFIEDSGHGFTDQYKARRYSYCFGALANALIYNGYYDKIERLVPKVNNIYDKYSHEFERIFRFMLIYNIAFCYFMTGKYKSALAWINRALNDKELDKFRGDYHSAIRILNILNHYELKNEDVVEYALESSTRFLKKKESFLNVEVAFTTHMKLIAHSAGKSGEMTQALQLFENAMKAVESRIPDGGLYQKEVLPFLQNWIQSKLRKTSIASIAKEQIKRRMKKD